MNPESDSGFIRFRCQCGQEIRAPVARAGAKGRCKACGRRVVVPSAHGPPGRPEESSEYRASPLHRRDLEGTYRQEDLVTYPDQPPLTEPDEKKSLFGELGEILRYPVSDKLAAQIFLTGAILFSPLVWKIMVPFRYLGCLGLLVNIFLFISIVSIRLMYFSYMLLIIEKSAEGDRRIPELPVFATWEEHFKDLFKVLGASAVAFSPFLVYAISANLELITGILEARARGEPPGAEAMGAVFGSLGALAILYAIAALYMPMVLMTLVVTDRFTKAVNPLFVLRSIFRIRKEYLSAMLIVFLFLRGSLTLVTIVKDLLAVDWFAAMVGNIVEPIIEFYALVVTMHVVGLLYYRNSDKLKW